MVTLTSLLALSPQHVGYWSWAVLRNRVYFMRGVQPKSGI